MSLYHATHDPLLPVSENVVDINTMRRTSYVCPMTRPKNCYGTGRGLRLNLDLLHEQPFRMRLRTQVILWRCSIILQ